MKTDPTTPPPPLKPKSKTIDLTQIVIDSFFKNKRLLMSMLITYVGFLLLYIVFPKSSAYVLDHVKGITPSLLAMGIAPFVLAQFLFYRADTWYSQTMPAFENTMMYELLQQILEAMKQVSPQSINKSQLMTHLLKVFEIKHVLHLISTYFMPVLLIATGLFIYFFRVNRSLAYTTLAVTCLSFVVLVFFGKKCLKQSVIRDQHHSHYTDNIDDLIQNIDKILISNNIPFEMERIKELKTSIHSHYVNSELGNANMKGLIAFLSIVVLFVIGNKLLGLFTEKSISKGDLMGFFYIVMSLIGYYDSASNEINNLFYYFGNLSEAIDYFRQFTTSKPSTQHLLMVSEGKLELKQLNLRLSDKELFHHFDATFVRGTKTGIVGRIGCGKSTLLKTILQFSEYEGQILIDGQDTKQYDKNEVRRNIGYLPQHPTFFNRSLMDNLVYGIDESMRPREKVVQLIRQYGLHEFIQRFPEGLDTMVVKNGENLSGGQRQILYFIKMLVEDKTILLLDEASASLDSLHKRLFLQILDQIKDKTILFVTHDKEVYPYLDRIVELK